MTPDLENSEEEPKRRLTRRRSKAAESEDVTASEATRTASDAASISDDQSSEADEAAEPVAASEDVDTQAEEKLAPEPATAPAPAVEKPKRARRGGKAAAKPAPAPSRRRAAREPGAPIPVVRAQAKYVRSSPRKARLVCDHIRGKTVEEARAILALTPRAVARDWSKLLESAVANAEHNHELVGEDLYVKSVHADDGPTIKRFRPRAMGRATKIRKRTSHLTILLTPKE
jgi:ribosomal protein L22